MPQNRQGSQHRMRSTGSSQERDGQMGSWRRERRANRISPREMRLGEESFCYEGDGIRMGEGKNQEFCLRHIRGEKLMKPPSGCERKWLATWVRIEMTELERWQRWIEIDRHTEREREKFKCTSDKMRFIAKGTGPGRGELWERITGKKILFTIATRILRYPEIK